MSMPMYKENLSAGCGPLLPLLWWRLFGQLSGHGHGLSLQRQALLPFRSVPLTQSEAVDMPADQVPRPGAPVPVGFVQRAWAFTRELFGVVFQQLVVCGGRDICHVLSPHDQEKYLYSYDIKTYYLKSKYYRLHS